VVPDEDLPFDIPVDGPLEGPLADVEEPDVSEDTPPEDESDD
jgi:hypothetical protein